MKIIELSDNECLMIRAGSMFDGIGGEVLKDVLVYVEDGKVKSIESGCLGEKKKSQFAAQGHSGFREIGGEEFTLLPGLIDCHVHIALDGCGFKAAAGLWNQPPALWRRVQADLMRTLSHGVVAVRDGGDRAGIGSHCRNKILDGELEGPLFFASGMALRKKGKYGGFLGPGLTADEVKAAVLRQVNEGADQIKVIVSGVVSFQEYGSIGEIQFSEEELKQIVETADKYGLKVMAHANSEQAVQLCIKAGIHTIEHGYFLSKDSLQAMADRGIAWIPTLVPLAVQLQGKSRKRHSPAVLAVIEKTIKRQLEMVALARDLGVQLGAGSDAGGAGVLHGLGLLQELELYRAAGLSGEEILMSATGTAAYILGKQGCLGIIRAGVPAYLLLVKGDPLKDIRELAEVAYVIKPKHQPVELDRVKTALVRA